MRRALFALPFLGALAAPIGCGGDDPLSACDSYCECAGCSAESCKTQVTSARAEATSAGCAVELDAYLLCVKKTIDCKQPFANAAACRAEAEALLGCGVARGLGTKDCEGTGRLVDALVAGCAELSQSGTYAPSTCDPVPAFVVDCRLDCAQQYDCSNSLDACLEGCATQVP